MFRYRILNTVINERYFRSMGSVSVLGHGAKHWFLVPQDRMPGPSDTKLLSNSRSAQLGISASSKPGEDQSAVLEALREVVESIKCAKNTAENNLKSPIFHF